MHYHSKEALVFMVQIDHLTGECIGQAIEVLYGAGASNVQVVPTITKKNRPSYIFFIDCRQQFREQIEAVIVGELGSGGWHVLQTSHYYQYNKILKKQMICKLPETGEALVYTAEGKQFESGTFRPEHDSVVGLKQSIRAQFGRNLAYSYLYQLVGEAFASPEPAWTCILPPERAAAKKN